jgi:Fe-S cluster biogenesis protein NfuA
VLYKSPCYHDEVSDTTALYDAVDKALDEIRPYIHSHAGDVNIIDVNDAGVVKLQMVGTCHGCPMSMLTLRLGIERILIEKVPGVTEIISIRPDDIDIDAFAGGDDDDE